MRFATRRAREVMAGFTLSLTVFVLSACGHSVTVTVVDERTGTAVPAILVTHGRMEWRAMRILPVQREIVHAHGQSDANGRIVFDDVDDDDILTVVGESDPSVDGDGVERIWFSPLQPIAQTKTGPAKLADRYRELNANSPPERITLPVQRERKP